MVKKGFILVLLITVSVIFTSCGLDYRYSLDESLHNRIECVWGNEEPSYITYQGDKYLFIGTTNSFRVDTHVDTHGYSQSYENDVLLSWNGYRYIWYIEEYYSYSSSNPIFIYEERTHSVFFREDYDYSTDMFVIENTDSEIVWADIFHSKQNGFILPNPIRVEVFSKQYPRIRAILKVERIGNQWYIAWPDSNDVWIPSEEFIKILSDNGIV